MAGPATASMGPGSPRDGIRSTTASPTVRDASGAENGARTIRVGGAKSRSSGTTSGSPAPPGSGSSGMLARVLGTSRRDAEPDGTSSTIDDAPPDRDTDATRSPTPAAATATARPASGG